MPDLTKPCQELHGWKDIAHYLGTSVRKAQTLEKVHKLPVRRTFASPKSPVYALSPDLDSWKSGTFVASSAVGVGPPEEEVAGSEPPAQQRSTERTQLPHLLTKQTDRRRWLPYSVAAGPAAARAIPSLHRRWWWLYGLGAFALLAAISLYWFNHRMGEANSFTVEGRLLKVFDGQNRLLWNYAFPPDIVLSSDGNPDGTSEWVHKFLDLGGYRGTEFLFKTDSMLYCFDRNGNIRWKHKPGREVLFSQGDIVPPNFNVKLLDVLSRPRSDGGRIIVGSSRGPGALFVVELLTEDGKKVGEYFHFGWFFGLAVGTLGKQSHEDIFLAGVDDASAMSSPYGATLVVLDPDRVSGQATTELANSRAALQDIAPSHEKAVLLIKEFAPNVEPSNYCRGRKITVLENSLELYVTQGQTQPSAYFLFDQKLQLQSVLPERAFQQMLRSTILKNVAAESWQDTMKRSLGDIIYVRNEFASPN
jgi:hypothetical protein